MSGLMDLDLISSRTYGATLVVVAGTLNSLHLISSRTYGATLVVVGAAFLAIDAVRRDALNSAIDVVMIALGWYLYRRGRDDDDDRGRRLLAWGKSKIARPTVVRLRPAQEDA